MSLYPVPCSSTKATFCLEVGLGLLHVGRDLLHDRHLFFHNSDGVSNLAFKPIWRHRHVSFDLFLHLGAAQIQIVWTAGRSQVLLRKLLQGVKISATLIVLQVAWVAILECRITADAVLFAQGLAPCGAIHIGHQRSRTAVDFVHQFVPIRFQLLAVATPRSKELDENTFPCCLCVPVLLCELNSGRATKQSGEDDGVDHPVFGLRSDY
mmetsp:Transcript_12147/g.15165  ORF Transcript_12147/g.15165 Transcript_12147/m.15165 type:complete len:209 (-) Transcript_12147:27-653(-)